VTRTLFSAFFVAAAVVLIGGLLDAGRVPDAGLRQQAYAMVLILTAVAVAARLPGLLGPASGRIAAAVRVAGLTVVAADVFATVEALRGEPHPGSIDPVVSVVWTVMLSVHILAILAVTGRRAGTMWPAVAAGIAFGAVAFALWALLCLMQPDIPQSNAPTLLGLALAAMTAIQWNRQHGHTPARGAAAGVAAATTIALLSGVLIDAGLSHLSRWVTTSAPPTALAGPGAPHRLVDPVGILILSTLLALTLLATTLLATRNRAANHHPETAPATAG
jgi:hypothetical protein